MNNKLYITITIKMNIIEYINNYISPLYTQKSKDKFSRLPLDKYKLLLNMYVNQHDIDYTEYALLKLTDEHIEYVDNYSTDTDKNTYNVLYYDPIEKMHLFQIYGFTNMYELIITNQNRYVFVPIMFSIKDKNIGHATMIIIDKKKLTIRFFDSNGLTKGCITSNIVDKFLECYFNIFNITFGEKYKYIYQEEWLNNNKCILNTSKLSNDTVNSGHCMIFTLLISHLISTEKLELNDIITELNKIKKEELLDIIMGYTECAIQNLQHIT